MSASLSAVISALLSSGDNNAPKPAPTAPGSLAGIRTALQRKAAARSCPRPRPWLAQGPPDSNQNGKSLGGSPDDRFGGLYRPSGRFEAPPPQFPRHHPPVPEKPPPADPLGEPPKNLRRCAREQGLRSIYKIPGLKWQNIPPPFDGEHGNFEIKNRVTKASIHAAWRGSAAENKRARNGGHNRIQA